MAAFKDLEGRLVDRIEGLEVGSEELKFFMHDGDVYKMFHNQDCCESVHVSDIIGVLTPQPWNQCWIVRAEESSKDVDKSQDGAVCSEEGLWTFYRMDTTQGCTVIRWLGTSNGYYSMGVDFIKVKAGE